jgi:hypothetical protein
LALSGGLVVYVDLHSCVVGFPAEETNVLQHMTFQQSKTLGEYSKAKRKSTFGHIWL